MLRIQETYTALLVPGQAKPSPDQPQPLIEWEEIRLQPGSDSLANRAWKKLKDQELIVKEYAGSLLRREIDSVPLWRGNHVTIKQLADDYSKYLYLQRLKDTETLLNSIKDGLVNTAWETETFAYADGFEEKTGRYLGLKAFDSIEPALGALVVHPEVARKQLDTDRSVADERTQAAEAVQNAPKPLISKETQSAAKLAVRERLDESPADSIAPTRFYGSVTVDATRLNREIGKISDEVISHLTGLVGAQVEVTIEVTARIPNGVPENVVRIVLENSKVLQFSSTDFEKE